MQHPFIRNHQFNLIQKQTGLLRQACGTAADPKVVESVRYGALQQITDMFPEATDEQRHALERISSLQTAPEFAQYLQDLEPGRTAFSSLTDKQLQKLFPKAKKLKGPNRDEIDLRHVTYLGWTDIASNKMYLVYEARGRLVGIEGRFTPAGKKSTCFLCNRQEEVALFTAITKTKPAGASPDYYKAIGNYLCADSEVCNKNITNVAVLEKFISEVTGIVW
ncbi:FusB/FusC family EF-G-binding protein [Cohnella sp. REN36]|uniref:FusB/FusC family EF-G-binding protein n=1 Tax=Cohnella sp. REN36 TaxID=2887347 RepID=UPI001D15873F|nr:FusB/FusC family EF-G-binding protein [Cohnella sp. REN36]MCC3371573.1 FusB/FusC family EF-G-binding protein [Cohnella sp. REN36]